MIPLCFILLSLGVLWSVYWAWVRPLILDRIDEAFEKLRSEVDWKIINGGLSVREIRAAEALAAHLATSDIVRELSMTIMVREVVRFHREATPLTDHERDLLEEAPAWVRRIISADRFLTMGAVLANSPAWWPVVAPVLLFEYFSDKTARWLEEFQRVGALLRGAWMTGALHTAHTST